ncbi:MAG TPA: DUF4396 domain-containing protein [Candidatus Limnocylindria bacterium]|nr:DUF4396 domain-containing protein [Candidatus Limnocylindria bacterium]
MNHAHRAPAPGPTHHAPAPDATRLALAATRHCLTGCAIGEVLGLAISGALGLPMGPAMLTGIGLAFVFGYALTFVPLLRSGLAVAAAVRITLAADTISIVVMETVDNLVVLLVTFPVNRWLIARGRGHAIVHGAHA